MKNPRVEFETSLGKIVVEIFETAAPKTAANFLRYVSEGLYAKGCFYRVVRMDNQPNNEVKIEVLQGGLKDDPDHLGLPAISHETTAQTGIRHQDGTLSMARNEPGSASSEFFICINDQPDLDHAGRRNPDGLGFAAFGKVVEGIDVVRKIQSQPVDEQRLQKDVPFKVRKI